MTYYLSLRKYVLSHERVINVKGFNSLATEFTSDSENERILVIRAEKVGKGELRNLISSSYWENYKFIVIYEDKITNECSKDVYIMNEMKRKIEVFSSEELKYNIFLNVLVPLVSVIDSEEREVIKEYYQFSKLPRITINDPVCRYLGVNIGDILRFSRTHNVPYYRIVV